MKKIRLIATFAIIIIVPFLIYYPYEALSWQLNMAFLDPQRWLNDGWAAPGVTVSWVTRTIYFAMWSPAVISGVVSLVAAIVVAQHFRQGVVFDLRVARGIRWIGWGTIASNVVHLIAASFSPMVVSWHNPTGPLPMRFWYSSQHISLILCGLGFLMMGAVMREAIKVARENEEFI